MLSFYDKRTADKAIPIYWFFFERRHKNQPQLVVIEYNLINQKQKETENNIFHK